MPEQASPEILTGLAEYCAWRGRAFAVSDTDTPQLELTARINYEREFGIALDHFVLSVERPTICDSRMMPQEWLRADDGRLFKLNAAIHGDDHFFPGPCDIAWDLAGVVVEWNLSPGARERFLAEYRRASGDDPLPRMSAYETAYATFRMAWSAMAAGSAGGAEEELRLIRNYTKYRDIQRGAASAAPLTPLLHLSSLGTARDDDSESDLARQAGGSYRL